LAAFLGPGALGISGLGLGAMAMPLASGAVTALTGGKLKDVLKSAAVGYLAGPTSPITGAIGSGLGALGTGLGTVGQTALASGLAGTTVGLLSGQKLKDAIGSGLMSGLSTAAMGTFGKNPSSAEDFKTAYNAPSEAPPLPAAPAVPPVDSMGTEGTGATKPPVFYPPAAPAAAPGTPAAAAAPGGYQKPLGIFEGFQEKGFTEGLKNAFMPAAPTEAQILASPELQKYQALGFKGNELMSKTAEAMGAPGAVRTYAPAVAAGLGIMGLSGGFKKTPVQLNAGQQAMVDNIAAQRKKVEENPGAYYAKGLEKFGIKYNDKGEIVGSSPWSSPYSMNDVRVESNAISPYMMTPTPPMPTYRGYAQGGAVDESFFIDSDGQQVPTSYGPPAPVEQSPAPTASPSPGGIMGPIISGATAAIPPSTFTAGATASAPPTTNLIDPVGPPIQSFTPPTPQQQRDALQQRIDMEKTILGSAEFGTQKHTNALQALSGLRSQLTAQDYALAHPAGVMSAAQTAGMAQGRDLAARMYPSLNPSAAAQMFPTVPRTTGRVPQPYNTSSMYSNLQPPPSRRRDNRALAGGGIASLAQGGYPRMTGAINGPGTETSDSIPAMLSNNEFVFTAKAVRAAGGGSARQGAKRMYALMHQLERNAARG
jgi:hypothetical protein